VFIVIVNMLYISVTFL